MKVIIMNPINNNEPNHLGLYTCIYMYSVMKTCTYTVHVIMYCTCIIVAVVVLNSLNEDTF